MKCKCHSYNGDGPFTQRAVASGFRREVVLPRPEWLPEGERVHGVPVDACIADTVLHLWANGIQTLASCCGHNGRYGKPNVVLVSDKSDGETVLWIRAVIAEVDDREWDLFQWQLVTLPGPAELPVDVPEAVES